MNNFTNSSSVISSDTVIKGKIDFKGELLIEGKASGDIIGDNLTLGPSAKVDGKISKEQLQNEEIFVEVAKKMYPAELQTKSLNKNNFKTI